jgi:hypothetical protein
MALVPGKREVVISNQGQQHRIIETVLLHDTDRTLGMPGAVAGLSHVVRHARGGKQDQGIPARESRRW